VARPKDTFRMDLVRAMRCSAVMVGLAVPACGKSKTSNDDREAAAAKRVKDYNAEVLEFELSIHPGPFADSDVVINFEGKPVGKLKKGDAHASVKLPRGLELSSRKSGLTATMDTTCGRSEVPLGVEFRDPDSELKLRGDFKRDGNYLTVGTFDQVPANLYIDNTKGRATTVSVGDTKLEIAANTVWEGRVRPGTCAHGRKVKIGDAEVGTLGSPPATDQTAINGVGLAKNASRHIIDIKGGRCYVRRERVYTDRATDYEAEKPVVMKGARVYDVPGMLHDFLTDAPRSMTVTVDPNDEAPNMRSRFEVSRCR
jgi:hypothetical protein